MKYSEEQLRAFINTIPTPAWSCSLDGSAESFNGRWLNYTGLSAEEASGWGWKAAIHPDDLRYLPKTFQEALDAGQAFEVEGRLRSVNGEFRRYLFRSNPLPDESGRVVKWYVTNTDIEDLMPGEDALSDDRRGTLSTVSVARMACNAGFTHAASLSVTLKVEPFAGTTC